MVSGVAILGGAGVSVRCVNTRQMCDPSAVLPCLSEAQSQDFLRLSKVAGRVDWPVKDPGAGGRPDGHCLPAAIADGFIQV